MPFALMWANENWTRRWDGAESEVLISQDYRPDDDERMAAEFARHFRDPRYIRLQGRPVLMVYRPGIIPDAAGHHRALAPACSASSTARTRSWSWRRPSATPTRAPSASTARSNSRRTS